MGTSISHSCHPRPPPHQAGRRLRAWPSARHGGDREAVSGGWLHVAAGGQRAWDVGPFLQKRAFGQSREAGVSWFYQLLSGDSCSVPGGA